MNGETDPLTCGFEPSLNFEQICAARSRMYGFLARLVREEVDEDLLESLKAADLSYDGDNDAMIKGYRLIDEYVSESCCRSFEEVLVELAVDYVRTFVGVGGQGSAVAHPYESVYTSEKRLLMQEAEKRVREIYRKADVSLAGQWKEGADHLAAELEFMQILCRRACEMPDADVEAQAVFVGEHLSPWVHLLAKDMRAVSKTAFYQGVSYLIEGFVQLELEAFR